MMTEPHRKDHGSDDPLFKRRYYAVVTVAELKLLLKLRGLQTIKWAVGQNNWFIGISNRHYIYVLISFLISFSMHEKPIVYFD